MYSGPHTEENDVKSVYLAWVGSVALCVAVLSGASGCATALPPTGTAEEEAAYDLSRIVMARLTEDPFLERASIQATSDEGVVTLRGMIRSEAQRMRALSIARSTAGVRGVIDSLRFY